MPPPRSSVQVMAQTPTLDPTSIAKGIGDIADATTENGVTPVLLGAVIIFAVLMVLAFLFIAFKMLTSSEQREAATRESNERNIAKILDSHAADRAETRADMKEVVSSLKEVSQGLVRLDERVQNMSKD